MDKGNISCPKCGKNIPDAAQECSQCGLVFARYKEARAKILYEAVRAFHDDLLAEAEYLFAEIKGKYPELSENADRHLAIIAERFQQRYIGKALQAMSCNPLAKAKELFEEFKSDDVEKSRSPALWCSGRAADISSVWSVTHTIHHAWYINFFLCHLKRKLFSNCTNLAPTGGKICAGNIQPVA